MRRTKRGEQSAFSLFPFLAVLLCTMGAMVVLLVAMAHVSRAKATREAELAEAAAEAARVARDNSVELQAARDALAEAEQLAAEARELREKGDRLLAQEQQRLSDIEDHLRRLVDEVEAMQVETQELVLVEEEHYDDAKIAAQELERLNALIGQLEEENEELKHAAAGRERKYAIVPLREGSRGTIRPPVYFECDAQGVVLQPEGIRLEPRDLVAPKFSNPPAAVSRAVTRYYEENPEARAANEVGAPYPLLVVRPDGINSYYLARVAFDGAGIQFGYQPIGDDWELEYGEFNPVLTQWVNEALLVAREQRRGLARVVPRLRADISRVEREGLAPRSVADGDSLAGGGAAGGRASGSDGGVRVSRADPDANNPFEGLRIEGRLPGEGLSRQSGLGQPGVGQLGAEQPQPGLAATGQPYGPALGGPQLGPPGGPGQPADATQLAATARAGQGTVGTAPQGAATASGQAPPDAAGAAGGAAGSGQSPGAPNQVAGQAGQPGQRSASGTGGGARGSAPQRSGVPIVRPIRLHVSRDRVVVLPDRAQSPAEAGAAHTNTHSVSFADLTSSQINELIAVLKRHADSWGIAGDGLYWDPRLVLNVTSDGAQRADEVRQLLEAAGLKVQAYPVATAANPGGDRATR